MTHPISADKQMAALVELVKVVVLCGIKSDSKEDVITRIMEMSEEDQQHLMCVINEATEHFAAAGASSSDDDTDLEMTRDAFEMMANRKSPRKSPKKAAGKAAARRRLDTEVPSPQAGTRQAPEDEVEKLTQTLRATKKERSTLQSELAAQKITTEKVQEEMKQLKYTLGNAEQEKELAVERAVSKAVADSQQRRTSVYREDKLSAQRLAQVNIDESEELRVKLESVELQLENLKSKHADGEKRGKAEIRQLKDELDLANDKAQVLVRPRETLVTPL
jgi:chromosome segregation ATPase